MTAIRPMWGFFLLLSNVSLVDAQTALPAADPVLTIQAKLQEAILNTSYSAVLGVTGGIAPYTWSLKSGVLPPGLDLSTAGVISGTPKNSGLFSFVVGVADGASVATTAALKIAVAYSALTIVTAQLPVATLNQQYYGYFYTSGGYGGYTWTVTSGALPPGLSLQPFGQITGTPQNTGSFSFTLQVADEYGASTTAVCHMTVRATFTPFPELFSVRNSASYAATIAPGSLAVLFGASLGPDQLVQASSFPLPFTLGGTSVTVTSGGITLDCPMVYVSATQVAVIVPSKTPVPTGNSLPLQFNVTYNYASSADYPYFYSDAKMATAAAGLYTLDSSGAGPGIFTSSDGAVKGFTNPARPGEIITTWATGLGAIDGDDALPPAAHNIPGVEVYVGTQPARVLYAGRSPCCSGLDQISFEVPQVGDSCFAAVGVRGGGVASNFVTLAVNHQGAPCTDSGPAIPRTLYSRAVNGEPLRMAALAVGPQGILYRGGFPQIEHVAALLSAAFHAQVSEEEAERLMRAVQKQDRRGIRRAMWKYRRQWEALDAQSRKALLESIDLTENAAAASFFTLNSSGSLMSVLVSAIPTSGNCTLTTQVPLRLNVYTRALDAGGSLSVTAPTGQVKMTTAEKGRYAGLLGTNSAGPTVPPGGYTVSSAGGADIGPFSVRLDVASAIHWTNAPAAGTSIDRSQPLVIKWSGGTPGGHVLIGGSPGGKGTFLCAEESAKGTLTIPSLFLSGLDPARQSTFFIGQHPLERTVSIPGLDYVVFVDASSDSKILSVR